MDIKNITRQALLMAKLNLFGSSAIPKDSVSKEDEAMLLKAYVNRISFGIPTFTWFKRFYYVVATLILLQLMVAPP
jgi:hypothetical protein